MTMKTMLYTIRRFWRLLFLPSVLPLSGCTSWRAVDIPSANTALPPALTEAFSVTWTSNNTLVMSANNTVWYRPIGESAWKQLPVVENNVCLYPSLSMPQNLPDGRLGLRCSVPTSDQASPTRIVAYDWSTGRLTPLTEPFPEPIQHTWHPTMTHGIIATIGAYSTLFWTTRSATTPVTVTLQDGEKTWYLPDSVEAQRVYDRSFDRSGRELHPVGLVRDPVWAPDGRQLAFWATLETIGKPFQFPVVPWDIYLMDTETLAVQPILHDVYDPGALAWSPDGQRLAFVAEAGNGRPQGIWLLSVSTGQTTLLRKGNYRSVTWSPDGSQIASIGCSDAACIAPVLWIMEVNSLGSTER